MKKLVYHLLIVVILFSCETKNKPLTEAERKKEAEREVTLEAAKDIAKYRTEVAIMEGYFDRATKNIISEKQALTYWNEGMGLTIGQAKNLKQAQALYNEKKQVYLEAMSAKAKSAAAFRLAEKAKVEMIKNEQAK